MGDLPDYTRQMVLRYEGGFIGLEELASRLGSVVPWDLQGNIMLAEDFRSEETEYSLTATGTGSSAARSSRRKFSGDWSIKLVSGDETDASANIAATIRGTSECKISTIVALGFEDDVKKLEIDLWAWDGTTYHLAILEYSAAAQTLSIYDQNGDPQVIVSSLRFQLFAFIWHIFRLDIDLETGYYSKLYLDGQEYDLSGYQIEASASVGPPFIDLTVTNYEESGVGCDVYVGALVVAKNVQ